MSLDIRVPRDWAMYTAAGNRALRQRAERLVAKVEKIWESDASFVDRRRKVESALVAWLASWEKMARSSKHGEAGDTAVREAVGWFHEKIVCATYGDKFEAYDEWERHRAAAWDRVSKKRRTA